MGGSPLAITFPLFTLELFTFYFLLIAFYFLPCPFSYTVYFVPHRFKSAISILPSLFTFAPHWRHPWFSHPLEFHAFLRPPIPLPTLQRFPPLHWDLNTRLNSRNWISNNIRKHVSLLISVAKYIYPSTHLPIYPSIHLPIYPSTQLAMYQSTHICSYPSTHYPPNHLPTYPPTHLPTYPLSHPPTYPPTDLVLCCAGAVHQWAKRK